MKQKTTTIETGLQLYYTVTLNHRAGSAFIENTLLLTFECCRAVFLTKVLLCKSENSCSNVNY